MTVPSLRELFTSPPNGGTAFHRDASETEMAILNDMEQHFGSRDYVQPTVEGSAETAPLSEREMMFLVSSHIDSASRLTVSSRGRPSCGETTRTPRQKTKLTRKATSKVGLI